MSIRIPLPNKNLKGSDIRDTLNSGGGVVNNNTNTWFSKTANINMWSRYKPVPWDIDFLDDETIRWKGYDGRCGLTIPTFKDSLNIKNALKDNGALWSYIPPKGKKVGEPRRIGDFREYYRDAVNPIGDIPTEIIVNRTEEGESISIEVESTVQAGNKYNLHWSDLTVNSVNLSDMYLGIYMVRTTESLKRAEYFKTMETPVGSGDLIFEIPVDYEEEGEFKAYFFLSTLPQIWEEGSGNNDFFIGINKEGVLLKLIGFDNKYIFTPIVSAVAVGSKEFTYEQFATNNTKEYITFKNIYIQVQHFIDGEWQNEGTGGFIPILEEVIIPKETKGYLVNSGVITHSVAFDEEGLKKGWFRAFVFTETPQWQSDPLVFEDITEIP